jgi:hypothetical protein
MAGRQRPPLGVLIFYAAYCVALPSVGELVKLWPSLKRIEYVDHTVLFAAEAGELSPGWDV